MIQFESAGTVRFDIDAGRILDQEMAIDKGVVGFRGEASNIHYLTEFSEEFVSAGATVAGRCGRAEVGLGSWVLGLGACN